jgi:hypothetical protein
MKIKTPRTLAKKYARRASAATLNYQIGIANPRVGEPRLDPDAPGKFATAVKGSQSAYARGWAPYREVLLKLKLPPRGKLGSKANVRRMRAVCEALHREKLRRKAMVAKNGAA